MSDHSTVATLVERLRNNAGRTEEVRSVAFGMLMREAADEIERLTLNESRAHLGSGGGHVKCWCGSFCRNAYAPGGCSCG